MKITETDQDDVRRLGWFALVLAARAPAVAQEGSTSPSAAWLVGELVVPRDVPTDEHAEVVLLADVPEDDESVALAQWMGVNWPELGRVSPGDDGRFRLRLPAELSALRVELDARYLYLEERVEIEDPTLPLVLQAKLGGSLQIRMIPPEGSALDSRELVGRSLTMIWFPIGRSFNGQPPQRRLKIDEDLELFAGGLSPEHEYELDGKPLPYAQLWLEEDFRVIPGAVRDVEVLLQEGVSVRGQVVDESGAAVADASVEAQCQYRPEGMGMWTRNEHARTASDGSFAFEGLHPTFARLNVSRDGYLPSTLERAVIGESKTLDGARVVLARGLSIAVAVRLPDGRPVQGARVRCSAPRRDDPDRSRIVEGETDASGRVELSGLEQEEQDVEVEARLPLGVESSTGTPVLTIRRPETALEWRASRTAASAAAGSALELVLQAPLALAGRVLERSGAPLTSFRISAAKELDESTGSSAHFDADEFFSPEHMEDFTSQDGGFLWRGLPVGRWRVRASAKGFLGSRPILVELPGPVEPLRFQLERAASLAGLVLDPSGNPVEGARIEWVWINGRTRLSRGSGAKTDAAGEFQSRGLDPGRLEVVARAKGFAPSEPQIVDVGLEQARSGLVLRLQRGGRIWVSVRDGLVPLAGVEIRLRPADGEELESFAGTTDTRGELESELLASGAYFVRADVEGRSDLHGRVGVIDGETTRITLGLQTPDLLRVRGTVTAGGRPMGGGSIRVHQVGTGDDVGSTTIQSNGSFELRLSSGGSVVFLVFGPSHGLGRFERELSASGEHVLDFDLPSGAMRGQLRRSDGQPLGPWAEMLLFEDDSTGLLWTPRTVARAYVDEAGSWSCSNLEAGKYSAQVAFRFWTETHALTSTARDGVVVGENEIVEGVDLVLLPGGSIEGSVRRADDLPLDYARVFARDESGRILHREGHDVGSGGRFQVPALSAGRVFLEAYDDTSATALPVPCDVVLGETATLDLVLAPATILDVRLERAPADLSGARLALRDARGWEHAERAAPRPPFVRAHSDSRRSFGPLPPGRWTLALTLPSGRAATAAFDLSGERERAIVLDLESP